MLRRDQEDFRARDGVSSGFEERDQLLRRLLGTLLGEKVAGRRRPPAYVRGVLVPYLRHVVEPLHNALLPPERQEGAFHLAVPVFLVVVEVDSGGRPIILAAPVDRLPGA